MKKRLLSILLMCCMVLTLLPTTAFAEESTETPPVCSCETACTADNMNKECPVCGAENAIPQNCGQYIPVEDRTGENGSTERADDPNGPTELSAADQVQAMIDALPGADEITDDNAEEVKEQLEAIDEAKEKLSDEEIDELDLSRYNEVSTVLGNMAGLMSMSVIAANAIDYGFTINGTAVTSENIGKLPGVTGTVSYDQNTKTLTLDGVTITSSAKLAIDCSSGVDAIKLVGANEILFTAEAAVASQRALICGIYQGNRDKILTVFGSSRSDSLKITVPKITEHSQGLNYTTNCIYVSKNLEIKSCTLDILNPEILYGGYVGIYSPMLYSASGNITIRDCDLKAVLGKDRSGEINKVTIGRIVCATEGDITITDSKVEAGVFSSSEGGTFAAIDGNNITVTGSELDLKVKVAANGDYSVRALHIENRSGKINLTNCIGTIEVGSSNQCKCFGIDIWPGAENECLTIDGCTLTINILGTNMTREKEQAILILDDSDTATNKWPIFKNISTFTYGDTADITVTKVSGNTDPGFWRKHYLKITAAPTALTLDQTALELVSGNNRTLTATVTPAHAEQNVTWTSSNESVATVVNGVVTAVSAGTATITASTAGLSASCTVTVKEPVYSVTLHAGGGTIADGKNVTEYTYGVGATLPTADAVTYTGHTFKGWYDNESLAGDPVTEISNTETGDKVYWARWEANTYTVTLNKNGGTIANGKNVTEYTYGEGAALPTAGDMDYTGHTFKGWYDNEAVTGVPVTEISDTETGNKEYWAKWEINQYTITVKPENGKADITITQDYGTPITAPTLTREGYQFNGWDKAFPTTMPAENLTITAQWTVNQYTITYDLAGGTVEGNPDTYTIETEAFNLKNPTKSGYTFTGWSGTGLDGENNMTVTIPTGSTGNRTYTAHWRYNGSGHSYSYYTIKATAGAGGSISPSGNVSVREGRDQTFTITPDKGYAVANVKIDGKSIGAVKSYTFENVSRTHIIEVIFMKANGNPQTGVFVDVATGSYYEDAVDWAVENGITQGTDDTHFSPDGICTRAQAVTFLWRAAGSPEPETRTMPFTDVPAGSYYYDAVLWAVENGITEGTSDTTFSPNSTCTRAQIVAFLWRSEKSPAAGSRNPFADVKSTAYYADAVLWAVENDITKGTTNTTFSPDADCTRAQIVTFLWRCKK